MLALFLTAFWYSTKHQITKPRWLLKAALYGLPLPWIACEAGWFVAEFGRQPWSIAEVLPVHVSVSNLSVADVVFTIVGYTVFYIIMFIIGFYLMKKFARKGPTPPADKVTTDSVIGLDTKGANA